MKIIDWKVYLPDRRFHVLLEVQTDEGTSGWGAAYSETNQVQGALQWLKRFVVGEDPLDIERVTEKLHNVSFWPGRGGAMTHAISAINIALWDIAAQKFQVPVATILGGKFRDVVDTYASILFDPTETLSERIEVILKRGFRAVKVGWHPFGVGSLSDDEELVSMARKAVGDHIPLMVDAGGSRPFWSMRLKDACERARMLADYQVTWFEEPLAPDDLEGYVQLTAESPVKIAHGEVLTRRQSYLPYLTRRALDIVQPDVSKVGGLSELRRIAWLASEHGIDTVPHGWNTAVGVAADIHLVASLPSRSWVEFNVGNALVEEVLASPFELDDQGRLPVPTSPGLGISIDTERLQYFQATGFQSETWTWDERGDFEV